MTTKRHLFHAFLLLSVTALVAAGCGGGSAGPTEPGGSATLNITEIAFQSLQLANTARDEAQVDPDLNWEEALAQVAKAHSEAMRDEGFFGHVDGSGQRASDRLRAAGIDFSMLGENLVRITTSSDPAAVAHRNLMDSNDHRENILEPGFRVAGIGVARSGNTYWFTQIFIRP